jgi:hypothetical protein
VNIHSYFVLVIGNWKIEKWHLWHLQRTRAVNNPNVSWLEWKRVL